MSAKGSIAEDYKTVELRKEQSLIPGETIRIIDADDIDRMYNDFYKYASSSSSNSVAPSTINTRTLDSFSPAALTLSRQTRNSF